MTFDPDAFLAEDAGGGFNPDAFLEGDAPGQLPGFIAQYGVKQADGNYLVKRGDIEGLFTPTGERILSGNEKAIAQSAEEAKAKQERLAKLLTFTKGGSLELMPKLAGIKGAVESTFDKTGEYRSLSDAYAKSRDEAKQTAKEAEAEAGLGWNIAGSVATTLPIGLASLPARIGLSGGVGAISSAAESDAKDAQGILKDALVGGGIGLGAGAAGEALGAGVNKLANKAFGRAGAAVARQATKDTAAVESEIASLTGKLGSETQQASRILENIQRAAVGVERNAASDMVGAVDDSMRDAALKALTTEEAQGVTEKVLANNLAKLPGKTASIQAIEKQLAEKTADAGIEAAKRTREYFAQPIIQTEVLPRIRQMAPRFGLAAAGAAAGTAYDALTGDHHGSGGFVGAVLGAPGMLMMLKNVAKSPRVQVAVSTKLGTLLQRAALPLAMGTAIGGRFALHESEVDERSLGDPDLAAEKLIARGGLKSVVGSHATEVQGNVSAAMGAPQGPLDKAIQQTIGVTLIGGALEESDRHLEEQINKVIKADKPAVDTKSKAMKSQDFGAKRMRQESIDAHSRRADEAATLATDPAALIERLAANTGSLADVAPNIAGAMARTTQRAVEHIAKLGATPPSAGPLAPQMPPTETQRHAFASALEVIQEPSTVLKRAMAGTLTPGAMAALREVYPMLARQYSDFALQRMSEGGKAPYRAKLMLGLLSGVDPDGSLAATARNQAVIRGNRQDAAPVGPSGRAPAKGADKLTLASRTALPSQQEANES